MKKNGNIVWPAIATLFILATTPAHADPDFTNVPDILQGAHHLLRDDDLLVLFQQQASPGPQQDFVATLQTASGTLSGNGSTLLANQVDHSGLLQGYSSSMAMGRLFAVSRDFGVILAPSTFGLTSYAFWGLTVSDSSVNPNSVIMRLFLPGDGPKVGTATQVLTGDFTGDGFDDVLAFYVDLPGSNTPPHIPDRAHRL